MKTSSCPLRVVLGAIAALFGLSVTACQADAASTPADPVAAPGLRDRDVGLAKKLIAEGAVVLDVRTPAEFATGHLPEATLIPVQELAERFAEVEQLAKGDKEKPIVVYCASGRRATSAKEMLVRAGYKNVMNAGGYSDLTR